MVGAIIGVRTFDDLETQGLILQQEIASGIGHQIELFLIEREGELYLLDEVLGLGTLTADVQQNILNNLLLNQRIYQEVILLDAAGQEILYLSRSEVILDSDLQSQADEKAYLIPALERETYFGPVRFDDTIREPLVKIAVPILDRRSGETNYVLIANLRFKTIWDLLSDLDLPQSSEAFIVDQDGLVVAHQNPSVVLRETRFALPEADGRATGLSGQASIMGTHTLEVGEQKLTVVAQEPIAAALAVATQGVWATIGMVFLSLAAAGTLALLAIRQIVRPIETLAATAQDVAGGKLGIRATVDRNDEIGGLAGAFNSMTQQLTELIKSLEDQVAVRTQELEATLAEQLQLVVELETKTKELERFNYTVSHDLKSPLITIKGFLGYIEQDVRAGNIKGLSDDLTRISQAASKMQLLLDQLLEVSRVGHVVYSPEEISLGVLAQNAVDMLAGRLAARDIQVDISPDLPLVYGDPMRLRELMENLIDNAAKFMGEQPYPKIKIGSQKKLGKTVFYVQDNGVGIAPQHQSRVFELFDQLDPEFEGSGVGLAIVRKIIEIHDGRIWLESEGQGTGTTFYFYLPEHQATAEERS